MDWVITPFRNVGPIKFGMSRAEVEQLIGPPEQVERLADLFQIEELKAQFADEVAEYRGFADKSFQFPKVTYKVDRVVELEFYPEQKGLLLADIHLFQLEREMVIQRMTTLDPELMANDFMVYAPNLGMSFGTPDSFVDNPSIVVFARERKLTLPPDLAPISKRR